jgi:metallo-beta-lactamase family protein
MKLHFLGAAREITSSSFLVETRDIRFLSDCGMVQGGKKAKACDQAPFAFDPALVDFVLLTHARIDHGAILPKLTRSGFEGPIYASEATADLLGVMLKDNGRIHCQ